MFIGISKVLAAVGEDLVDFQTYSSLGSDELGVIQPRKLSSTTLSFQGAESKGFITSHNTVLTCRALGWQNGRTSKS